MSYLNIQSLKFSYDEHSILKGIDLQLKKGHLASLIGPSGCGKTTLLRLIAGFEKCSHGCIEIDNIILDQEKNFIPPEKRNVGMVFQDYALFPHLSVRENILFGCHKLSSEDALQQLKRLSHILNLDSHLDKKPHQLSGGQQQRVALARAIAPKPRLLLLDEPFSNLDASLKKQLAKEIKKLLNEFGVTALMVTHDILDSFGISDEMGILFEGQMMQWNTPHELYENPKSLQVAKFIAPGQLLECELNESNELQTEFGIIPLSSLKDYHALSHLKSGRKFSAWIKPQDLKESPQGNEFIIKEIEFQGNHSLIHFSNSKGKVYKMETLESFKHQVEQKISIELRPNQITFFEV